MRHSCDTYEYSRDDPFSSFVEIMRLSAFEHFHIVHLKLIVREISHLEEEEEEEIQANASVKATIAYIPW